MKKFLSVSALSLLILAASSSTFAANNVSNIATQKGGQHVAECAQTMERGVSECAKVNICME